MPTFIEDPAADARSLMHRAACICDGERTGIPCKHYWSVIQKFRAANADSLRSGEKQRACTLCPSFLLEWTTEEQPTFCGRYEPRKTPGLIALVKRAARSAAFLPPKAGQGYEARNLDFETFRPLTKEEIEQLRKEMPDEQFANQQSGKPPTSWTVDDIVNGPQIGILKPGEQLPSQGLSSDTEKALDEMFGTSAKEEEKP